MEFNEVYLERENWTAPLCYSAAHTYLVIKFVVQTKALVA